MPSQRCLDQTHLHNLSMCCKSRGLPEGSGDRYSAAGIDGTLNGGLTQPANSGNIFHSCRCSVNRVFYIWGLKQWHQSAPANQSPVGWVYHKTSHHLQTALLLFHINTPVFPVWLRPQEASGSKPRHWATKHSNRSPKMQKYNERVHMVQVNKFHKEQSWPARLSCFISRENTAAGVGQQHQSQHQRIKLCWTGDERTCIISIMHLGDESFWAIKANLNEHPIQDVGGGTYSFWLSVSCVSQGRKRSYSQSVNDGWLEIALSVLRNSSFQVHFLSSQWYSCCVFSFVLTCEAAVQLLGDAQMCNDKTQTSFLFFSRKLNLWNSRKHRRESIKHPSSPPASPPPELRRGKQRAWLTHGNCFCSAHRIPTWRQNGSFSFPAKMKPVWR